MHKKDSTKQKLAELEALQRSQAVIYFTPKGTILDANENFLAAVGYTLDEIKGQHHRIFVSPEYAASSEYAEFWKRLEAGEFFTAQYQRFGKGGKEVWIEASYNPIFDAAGKVERVVKYASDITSYKLQNLEYEGQIDAIDRSNAVIHFTPQGEILDANENFLSAMGYTLAEIKGKHHRIFVSPNYANSVEYAQFWQRLEAGEFFSDEFQRFGKGGKEVWIQATYNPILDVQGRTLKVIKYASDITKQKLAAADASSQIAAISKSSAVIEFDLKGNILHANENFLSAMGYNLEEIQGKHHSMFVESEEAKSDEYFNFWKKLAEGEFISTAFKRIKKNGDSIWIQASYNPVFDPNGNPIKVVKYATDITKIVDVADIADQTSQSVAAAVEEMTSSITEISSNMMESQQAAEKILSDSTEAGTVSEQLKESMTAMQDIVALIEKIASQVNLLALNATIEAARAGDAGKGFAVVAAEVKNLANQAADATEKISSQIAEVEDVAMRVAENINSIADSANAVNETVISVSSAVEEQSAVAGEISTNSQKLATSVTDMTNSIKNSSAA